MPVLAAGSARAEEPAADREVLDRLVALIRTSQKQETAGQSQEALSTLAEAKLLATAARRDDEVRQIDRRIADVQEKLAAAKAKAAEDGAQAPVQAPAKDEGDGKTEVKDAGAVNPANVGVLVSLEDCIEIAIQNNLSLKISRLNDRTSDIAVREAWAKYYPDFDFGVSHSGGQSGDAHSNSTTLDGSITQTSPWGTTLSVGASESIFHPGGPAARRSSDWGAALSQPLWKGAGLDVGMHGIRSSRINRLISRGLLELDVQDLIFDVKTAYQNCIRQLQSLQVNLRAVKSAETFLRLTEAQEKAGRVTKLEVYNAEVQLADRKLALTTNERQLEDAKDTLKRLMDVDLEEKLRVEEVPVEFGENPPEKREVRIETDDPSGTVLLATYEVVEKEITREDGSKGRTTEIGNPVGKPVVMYRAKRFDETTILSEALTNRIDLLNSRRGVALQKLDTLLARDGLGHQIDLDLSYGRSQTGGSFKDSHGYEDHDYSAEIRMKLPWGKIKDRAAYERALLDLQKAEIQLKDARTQVHLETRDILRRLREGEKVILIQGKKVEQAKRTVEASQISFERGLKDSFDVIQAEDNLLRAKTDFINATIAYTIFLAQLERVVGKPTGRVDLSGQSVGGLIDSTLPGELRQRPQPKPAPDAEADPADEPLKVNYRRVKMSEDKDSKEDKKAKKEKKAEKTEAAPETKPAE
ncbi:MAG: TolC family protein [Planctomycetes bacterium]|nr:TolC family protein [Planctomycetota bacterium]